MQKIFRKVSKDLILNVLKARLDEISEMIEKQITVTGINLNSEGNIFINNPVLEQLINISQSKHIACLVGCTFHCG